MVIAGKFETHEVEGGGGEMYASKLKLSHKKSMRLRYEYSWYPTIDLLLGSSSHSSKPFQHMHLIKASILNQGVNLINRLSWTVSNYLFGKVWLGGVLTNHLREHAFRHTSNEVHCGRCFHLCERTSSKSPKFCRTHDHYIRFVREIN